MKENPFHSFTGTQFFYSQEQQVGQVSSHILVVEKLKKIHWLKLEMHIQFLNSQV